MAKLNKKELENTIDKLKQLNNSKVRYGIFGDKANKRASNSRLKIGVLANILERGASLKYKKYTRIKVANTHGEERYFSIKAGQIINIPSRRFFGFTYSTKISIELPKLISSHIKRLLLNKNSVPNILNQIGKYCKESLIETIEKTQFIPLSELQIWKKGHNDPFYETGTLKNAIDYKVNQRIKVAK